MKNLILLLSLIIFGKYAYTQNITFVNADNNIPVAEVSIISKTNANIWISIPHIIRDISCNFC